MGTYGWELRRWRRIEGMIERWILVKERRQIQKLSSMVSFRPVQCSNLGAKPAHHEVLKYSGHLYSVLRWLDLIRWVDLGWFITMVFQIWSAFFLFSIWVFGEYWERFGDTKEFNREIAEGSCFLLFFSLFSQKNNNLNVK